MKLHLCIFDIFQSISIYMDDFLKLSAIYGR